MRVTILAECQGGWMDLWHIILMETSMMPIPVIMAQKPKVLNFTLFHTVKQQVFDSFKLEGDITQKPKVFYFTISFTVNKASMRFILDHSKRRCYTVKGNVTLNT